MRRLSLVSTAVLGLAAASPALAQQTGPEQPAGVITGAPAPAPVPEQAEHQVGAQSLLGVDVSNGEATIGEVSDLVVTEDGRVEAVMVGVGGVLGIGGKGGALAWNNNKLSEEDGGRGILVLGHQ